MLPVLDDPAIRARAYPISVEAYHHLFDLEQIPKKVELIRGAIFEKMSQTPLHASIVELLRELLPLKLPSGFFVRQEKPLTLADSEPEPDLAVIQGERREFLTAHPATAELVIEVVVSSERIDRVKLGIYAEAGVRESWLILAEERIVERHTEPQGGAYQHTERITFPATLESTVLPGLTLPPAGLFPG
jgi:Uma2 family endonuclease